MDLLLIDFDVLLLEFLLKYCQNLMIYESMILSSECVVILVFFDFLIEFIYI